MIRRQQFTFVTGAVLASPIACRAQVTVYKLPEHLLLAALPRKPVGKVLKRKLRDLLEA